MKFWLGSIVLLILSSCAILLLLFRCGMLKPYDDIMPMIDFDTVYVGKFNRPLEIGTGVRVPVKPYGSFSLNLWYSNTTATFHLNPRFDDPYGHPIGRTLLATTWDYSPRVVVRNAQLNNRWGNEERDKHPLAGLDVTTLNPQVPPSAYSNLPSSHRVDAYNFPFAKEVLAEITLLIGEENIEVYVNGRLLTTFNHRVQRSNINQAYKYISLRGNVAVETILAFDLGVHADPTVQQVDPSDM